MVQFINIICKWFGLSVQKHPHYIQRNKIKLFHFHKIDLVIDVGANTGQFAMEIRKMGYKGQIISFEPLSTAFKILNENAKQDSNWQVFNIALGDFDGTSEINIAGNSQSSSLLESTKILDIAAPSAKYEGKESIEVKKLDSVFNMFNYSNKNAFLKVDTQGFEKAVLDGAENTIQFIKGMQLEMCTTQVYKGSSDFSELFKRVDSLGYKLCLLEPALSDPTSGRLLEVDGSFYKF